MSKLNDLLSRIITKVNNTATQDDVRQLSAEMSDKVTSPSVAEVGQVIAVKAVDENGKPTEWEAVDMAAGGVQPDWNQTDESAADFIKNKPFGDTVAEIMPETELVGTEEDGIYTVYIDHTMFSGDESQLTVTFDGVEYICNVIDLGNGISYFGNMKYLGGDDTGEPFILGVMVDMGVAMIGMADEEPHAVRITKIAAVKLDKKYIDVLTPFYVNTSDDTDVYLYADVNLTTKVTLRELTAYSLNGIVIRYTFNGIVTATSYPYYIFTYAVQGYGYVATHFDGESTKQYYTAEYVPRTT